MNEKIGKQVEDKEWPVERHTGHHSPNEPKSFTTISKLLRVARVGVLLLAILYIGQIAWRYPDAEIPDLVEWVPENTKLVSRAASCVQLTD